MNSDRLYYITQDLDETDHLVQFQRAMDCGIRWIQLRSKILPPDLVGVLATQCSELLRQNADEDQLRLIVNDHVGVVNRLEGGGVHLGKNDMPVGEARRILGPEKLIGGTADSLETAICHWRAGADYLGLGPFRYTQTKKNLSPVLGLEGLAEIASGLQASGADIPVFAIGGILPDDVERILETGVFGVAVASAINESPDPEAAIHEFQRAIQLFEKRSTGQKILN